MLTYCVPLIPTAVFWWIMGVSDRYLVKWFVESDANGIYAVAYKIPTILTILATVFMDAWQLSAIAESGDRRAQARFYARVWDAFFSAVCLCAGGIIAFSPLLIRLLAAESYYDAWRYIPILTLSMIAAAFSNFMGSVYVVTKKSTASLWTSLAGAAANIALDLLLIPRIGVQGAAAATFLGCLLVFLMRTASAGRLLPFRLAGGKLALGALVLLVQTAAMLLKALVCYLHYEAPPDEQNFSMVMEMIRAGDVKEDNEEYQSVLDELFERLEERNPEHIALKYYRAYHSGSAKTLKSIQISLVSRLEKFNLDSLAGITQCDEMDLGQIGEKKTAVFAVIPDNDSSFNFIVGMLYTQLFQQLYYQADSVHGGRLPVHVHFVMDEFANVALPDEFDKLLSTMRSREISVSIIIQNLAQLKALFEKQWESIVGNCDEFLYLGGNEQSTHEYVSKLLGKETIDTNTYGRSRGRNGSYSTNYQLAGRELMTPDEVRMLDNRYALLFIRGERPIRDLKYDILHHPNVALTTDGSAPAYTHGEDTRSIASMAFSFDKKAVKNAEKLEAEKHEFLLYSEEELEELLDEKEQKDNEEA